MFNYILAQDDRQYMVKRPYYIENNEDMMRLNIDNIEAYYRRSAKMVPNNEPIVRLIKLLYTVGNVFEVNAHVSSVGDYYSKRVGIGSSVARPRMTTVGGNDALIISCTSDMSILDYEDYKGLTPLKPLQSDTVDISCNLVTDMDLGLTIYTLDIVMLMNQFHYYMKDNPESNARAFVLKYVYGNMVKYFLELAIINLYLTDAIPHYAPKHPFTIINIERALTKIIRIQKQYLTKTKRPYMEALRNIHLPYSGSADTFLNRKIPIVNRQNQLALYIALANVTYDLIYFLGDVGIKRNLKTISQLRIGHDRMASGNVLDTLDLGIYEDIKEINFISLYNILKTKQIL